MIALSEERKRYVPVANTPDVEAAIARMAEMVKNFMALALETGLSE